MTDKDIDIPQLARKWAVDCQGEGKLPAYGIAAQAAAEYILATTTPLTMADVEWDDKEHYLSGAVDSDGIEVVMMGWRGLLILVSDVDQMNISYAPVLEDPKDLTPNGKRYELRDIGAPEQPEHPATLETLEDYENAPVGTIVASDDHAPLLKRGPNAWTTEISSLYYDEDMARNTRQVLRWGWGE